MANSIPSSPVTKSSPSSLKEMAMSSAFHLQDQEKKYEKVIQAAVNELLKYSEGKELFYRIHKAGGKGLPIFPCITWGLNREKVGVKTPYLEDPEYYAVELLKDPKEELPVLGYNLGSFHSPKINAVYLFHELTHYLHLLEGTIEQDLKTPPLQEKMTNREEEKTIAVENLLRGSMEVLLRDSHKALKLLEVAKRVAISGTLSQMLDLPFEMLSEADLHEVMQLIKTQNLKMMQDLDLEDISDEKLNKKAYLAAALGAETSFKSIAWEKLSDDELQTVLNILGLFGHSDLLQYFPMNKLSIECIQPAIILAGKWGNVRFIRSLISLDMQEDTLKLMIIEAAKMGSMSTISNFLTENFPDDTFEAAYIEAAKHGQLEVMMAIPLDRISHDVVVKAAMAASENRQIEALKAMPKENMSPIEWGRILWASACTYKSYDLEILSIIPLEKISSEHMGKILHAAAVYGRLKLIQALSLERIELEYLKKASEAIDDPKTKEILQKEIMKRS